MIGFSYTPCPDCSNQVGYVLGDSNKWVSCSECNTRFHRRTKEVAE